MNLETLTIETLNENIAQAYEFMCNSGAPGGFMAWSAGVHYAVEAFMEIIDPPMVKRPLVLWNNEFDFLEITFYGAGAAATKYFKIPYLTNYPALY